MPSGVAVISYSSEKNIGKNLQNTYTSYSRLCDKMVKQPVADTSIFLSEISKAKSLWPFADMLVLYINYSLFIITHSGAGKRTGQ